MAFCTNIRRLQLLHRLRPWLQIAISRCLALDCGDDIAPQRDKRHGLADTIRRIVRIPRCARRHAPVKVGREERVEGRVGGVLVAIHGEAGLSED